MRFRSATLLAFFVSTSAFAPEARSQGKFSNFETPQTHPVAIASVGGNDYVLVCNTPDNSVAIYRATAPHTFVQRVPVGMGPATVRWNAGHGRFYTCNFDGDSVSVVRLDQAGSSVNAVLERTSTFFVGDEPSDITFDPTNTVAAVSLSSRSAVTLIDPLTLAFAGGEVRLTTTDPATSLPLAVKMPRQIAWLSDNRFFAANLRAGSPLAGSALQYDIGIYRNDPAVGPADFVGGLGTTNHAFAVNSTNRVMFVVGTKAQNRNPAAVGVSAVRQLKTGFVQSWLMVVDIPPGGALGVRGEALPGVLPAQTFRSINLNRDYSAIPLTEVATQDALVQPTDVALIESGGVIQKIVLTAFHSDRVAILTPTTTQHGGYAVQRVNLPVLTPASGYTTVGPRGLAYSAQAGLVFTNGRLDNTLAAIDPSTATLTFQVQLPNDPTPTVIREGRQFLYSNRFSINDAVTPSTGGFVSCAACHVDARTDGLPWNLGETAVGPAIPGWFHDQNGQTVSSMPNFPPEKGPMVTQTLQGLVNYELNESFQAAATNAPYHWRGDKPDFVDFNEAFVNLQGMDDVSTGGGPKGISDTDMVRYRRFVNTVLHPSNPEQNVFRVTPGTLGANPNDPTQATGAKLGMMLFHDFPMVSPRSCVDCHPLPDGSSNTSTLTFGIPQTLTTPTDPPPEHPLESAALRNIAQREMVLHNDFTDVPAAFTANSGLLHPGDFTFLTSFTINTFIHANFAMPLPNTNDAQERAALTEFVRQLDTGVAPAAGFAYTVDPALGNTGLNQVVFDGLEGQVEDANVGLGVYTRNGGVVKGYWYDVTGAVGSTGVYREEGTTNTISRATLLGLAVGTGNVVIAQGTPLGAERRWASANGVAAQIADTANPPNTITLENMAPNTAFVDVTKFNLQLNLGMPVNSGSIWSQRTLQQTVAGGGWGVPAVRHEPPRRFRITGTNVRPGAKLLFAMASGTTPASFPVQIMEMEIYPTRYASTGRRVWETNAELDAMHTFALLNGGYWAPDVLNVLLRTVTTGPSLDPTNWNRFLVAVLNEDGTIGFSTTNWQVLRVQDGR